MSFRNSANRAGLAAVLMILWAFMMMRVLSKYPFPHVFHHDVDSPGIALQISHDATDIDMVLHRSDPDAGTAKSALLRNNQLDLVFIPLYAFFLWSLARVFTDRTKLMAGVIIGTALFDYWEDWRIFRALDGSDPAIFVPSLAKWALLGLALIGIGSILIRSTSPVYSVATKGLLGVAYLIAGSLLVVSVAAGEWIGYSLIEAGAALFALLTVVQVIGLLGHYLAIPGMAPDYVDDFCEERKKTGKESLLAVKPGGRE
jgi:hypothetical protein